MRLLGDESTEDEDDCDLEEVLEGQPLEVVVDEAGVSSSEKEEMEVAQSLLSSSVTSETFMRSSVVTSMTELPWMASKTAGMATKVTMTTFTNGK